MLTSLEEGILDVLSIVAVVAYMAVAIIQMRRPVSKDATAARNGFVLWWGGIAFVGVFGLLLENFFELTTLTGFRIVIYTFIPLIFIALGGLVYYLLYLYTGKRQMLRVVTTFYTILLIGFIVFVEAQQPYYDASIDAETGEPVGFEYANEAPTWAGLLFSIALVLPPFAAAVAYFALFFQTQDSTIRYRIGMVSGGFILWMGFSLLGSLTRFASGVEEQTFTSQLTSQLLGILSALLVLMAYYPPGFLRKAIGLQGLDHHEETVEAPVDIFLPDKKAQHTLPGQSGV